MVVYLLHFDSPYFHARHYLGWTSLPLETRLDHHRTGHGARLLQVITEAGINFTLARTWEEGDRALERRLKNWHKSRQLCPICQKGT